MSAVQEYLRIECSLGVHHADSGRVLRHYDPCDNHAFHVVNVPLQRTLSGKIRKSKTRAEIFDACETANEGVLDRNWFGKWSRDGKHSCTPCMLPEKCPGAAADAQKAAGAIRSLRGFRSEYPASAPFPSPLVGDRTMATRQVAA